jgi:hypothetical protein
MQLKYKRILLKLSGESLMGDQQFGIDAKMLFHYANQIKGLIDIGVQIAVVIGGGNIFRGLSASKSGIERVQGDYMGMMATVMVGTYGASFAPPPRVRRAAGPPRGPPSPYAPCLPCATAHAPLASLTHSPFTLATRNTTPHPHPLLLFLYFLQPSSLAWAQCSSARAF